MIKSISDAVALSGKKYGEIAARFEIDVHGEKWSCYTVSVSSSDVLCYCDKGVATYVIDRYGDRTTFELFDWEKD